MTVRKALKIAGLLALFFGVIAYSVYAVAEMSGGDPNEVCDAVDLLVEDNQRAAFIDGPRVEELLLRGRVHPKGRLMRDVNVRRIEDVLRANKFIRQVACYKTNNGMPAGKGKVCIRVSQRMPLLYVVPDGRENYYVDAMGTIVPERSYAKDLVVATGSITQRYATGELARFGEFVQRNDFWDSQIEQVHVALNHKHQRVVTLVPRVGDHVVFLGTLDNFEKKLNRLRVFYEKGLPKVGWNKYSRINLEYDNQVVCTKK